MHCGVPKTDKVFMEEKKTPNAPDNKHMYKNLIFVNNSVNTFICTYKREKSRYMVVNNIIAASQVETWTALTFQNNYF